MSASTESSDTSGVTSPGDDTITSILFTMKSKRFFFSGSGGRAFARAGSMHVGLSPRIAPSPPPPRVPLVPPRKALQLQTKKMGEFQEETMRWNKQHHENLKRVLNSLQQLSGFLAQTRAGKLPPSGALSLPSVFEDPSLGVPQTPSEEVRSSETRYGTAQTLHEFVMSFNQHDTLHQVEDVLLVQEGAGGNGLVQELEGVFAPRATKTQSRSPPCANNFVHAKHSDSSAEIILTRLIATWLSPVGEGGTQNRFEYGLIYTELLLNAFPLIFSRPHTQRAIGIIVQAIERAFDTSRQLNTFSAPELAELRRNIVAAQFP
jgi:hypothetical protein